MRPVTMYQANDGKLHRTESECLAWEKRCDDFAAANEMFFAGSTVLDALDRAGQSSSLSKQDRDLLSLINRDTAIAIPHWQCRDQIGYKPSCLELDGRIYVYGHAGSWSGPYGNSMFPSEFARLVRESINLGHELPPLAIPEATK